MLIKCRCLQTISIYSFYVLTTLRKTYIEQCIKIIKLSFFSSGFCIFYTSTFRFFSSTTFADSFLEVKDLYLRFIWFIEKSYRYKDPRGIHSCPFRWINGIFKFPPTSDQHKQGYQNIYLWRKF